jgi:hypothetical protein
VEIFIALTVYNVDASLNSNYNELFPVIQQVFNDYHKSKDYITCFLFRVAATAQQLRVGPGAGDE